MANEYTSNAGPLASGLGAPNYTPRTLPDVADTDEGKEAAQAGQQPTTFLRALGDVATGELAKHLYESFGSAPERDVLKGREIARTEASPDGKGMLAGVSGAGKDADVYQAMIDSMAASERTAAAGRAVASGDVTLSDYARALQEQRGREADLYGRGMEMLSRRHGDESTAAGFGSASRVFGGTDTYQAAVEARAKERADMAQLLTSQFERAEKIGALSKADAEKLGTLRQLASQARVDEALARAKGTPVVGGPESHRLIAPEGQEPQAPPAAAPQDASRPPAHRDAWGEFKAKLGSLFADPTAPGETTNVSNLAMMLGLSPGVEPNPVTDAAPATAAATPVSPGSPYPAQYSRPPITLDAERARQESQYGRGLKIADAEAALEKAGGTRVSESYAHQQGHGAGVKFRDDIARYLATQGMGARHLDQGNAQIESREDIAKIRADAASRAKGVMPHGEVPEETTVKLGTADDATRIHIPNKDDRKFAARIVPDIDAMVEGIQEIRDMSKTPADRVLNKNKIEAAQKYVRERATGVSTTFAHSNRAAEPVMANAAGAAGTLAAADVFRRPEALGADSDAVMADAIARMTRARDAAIARIGGTPVVREVDEYGAPHFRYVAPGQAPPTTAAPGGGSDYTPKGTQIKIGNPAAAK